MLNWGFSRAPGPGCVVAVIVLASCTLAGCGGGAAEKSIVTRAEYTRTLAGSPPQLAQLHSQGSRLLALSTSEFRRLLDSVRGYPVVINAWAHWCAPCVQEFPDFQQAALKYGDRVAFLGVNETDTTADARRFADRFPVPYPHVEDPDGKILDTVVSSVPGLPMTIFLDRNGRLEYVRPGKLASKEALYELIERYALGSQ